MKKHLVSYGTNDFSNALDSLARSSEEYFDELHIFGPKDLDVDFRNNNHRILNQPRGAGYWIWKPYVINKVLNESEEGDIVFYIDSTNIFNKNPDYLFEEATKNPIVLFDNRDGSPDLVRMPDGSKWDTSKVIPNYVSCKRDSFVIMECDDEKFINGPHLNAAYQLYRNCIDSRNFIQELLSYCTIENLVTDTPNQFGNNHPFYFDHRHDQTILSLLAIKHSIEPKIDPSQFGDGLFNHHRNRHLTIR